VDSDTALGSLIDARFQAEYTGIVAPLIVVRNSIVGTLTQPPPPPPNVIFSDDFE
jgi:hypothetical protein